MPKNLVLKVGVEADPEKRRRQLWAESLREHLELRELSRKEFQARLATVGCNVTHQTVGAWLRAEWAPRPHHQAAIAAVFQVPVHRLFPIELAA